MVGRILKRSFWSWWDNLSYSLVTALVGSLNPSFLVVVPTVVFLLTTDVGFLRQNWWFWGLVLSTAVGGMWLWPLSVVSHALHEELANGPVLGYFKRLWELTKMYFLRSLGWWFLGTIVGALFGLSFVFYNRFMGQLFVVGGIFLFVLVWLFLMWVMMEMVLVVAIYKSGLKWQEMLLVAGYTVMKYALVYLGILAVSWVIYVVLMIPAVNPITMVIPLVTVYGIGGMMHIWTFRAVFDEWPSEEKKRSLWELLTPFKQLWRALTRMPRK